MTFGKAAGLKWCILTLGGTRFFFFCYNSFPQWVDKERSWWSSGDEPRSVQGLIMFRFSAEVVIQIVWLPCCALFIICAISFSEVSHSTAAGKPQHVQHPFFLTNECLKVAWSICLSWASNALGGPWSPVFKYLKDCVREEELDLFSGIPRKGQKQE